MCVKTPTSLQSGRLAFHTQPPYKQNCWHTRCAGPQGVPEKPGTRGSQDIEGGSYTRRQIEHGAIACVEGVDNGDCACVEYRAPSFCDVVVSGERNILERTNIYSKKGFQSRTFPLGQHLFWAPQQFAGRDVSHAWFGLSLWRNRPSLARERLLRPSHGALSATDRGVRLRVQRCNKMCTPDACAAMSCGGNNSSTNQLLRAACCAVSQLIVRFELSKLST